MNESALNLFRNACGLRHPLTLECGTVAESSVGAEHVQFECPFALIGRDSRSDLVLDDTQISRRHAFFQAVAGRMLVVDLHSRTKVFWDREETPRSQGWLDRDQSVRVGPYVIRCADQHTGGEPIGSWNQGSATGREQSVDDMPKAGLESPIRMGGGSSLWTMDKQFVLVGGSDDCHLVLSDDSVSRLHAALVLTQSGVWVVDLLGREGVQVNGTQVRWAWLDHGDSLRFGRLAFIVRYETAPNDVSRQLVPLEAGASPVEAPGTELALRDRDPHVDRVPVVVHSTTRTPAVPRAARLPSVPAPTAGIPSTAVSWEQMGPYPPHPAQMWQQQMQMMESFHKEMVLMVQMFVAMHREHSASFRHELARVQQLTQELRDLQAKLAQPSRSADSGGLGRPDPSYEKLAPAPNGSRDKNRQKKPAPPQSKKAAAKPEPRLVAHSDTKEHDLSEIPSVEEMSMPGTRESGVPSAGGDANMHVLLTKRIAELQRERQGYWRKILNALHD